MCKESKKVFIFLPDGVGLRNFAFNKFYEVGQEKKLDISYWNNTVFSLKDSFNYQEVKITNSKSHPFTDLFKRARKEIELKQNYKNFKNKAYLSYHFPYSFTGIKTALKSSFVILLSTVFNSEKGLVYIRKKINSLERKSAYYKRTKAQLEQEKPDFIFSTNQRPLSAIAPLLAAKDLKIPTATFIFSWDNLPKGMMVVETDYYFVWSNYMKQELLKYYPYINENQIRVVGTPQFDVHFKEELFISKENFYTQNNLDKSKEYICYSGDDVTTSPNDQFYLEDVALAVKEYNKTASQKIGVIFRRCPVDFSKRYDKVLQNFSDIIVAVNPIWKPVGKEWNTIMPTPEDTKLLINTMRFSKAVINLGSTMVFDAASHHKPCAYVNYNTNKKADKKWNVAKIYKYIHFKSMPNQNAVIWLNSKERILPMLKEMLGNPLKYSKNAQRWMDVINTPPHQNATETIWNEIEKIINE